MTQQSGKHCQGPPVNLYTKQGPLHVCKQGDRTHGILVVPPSHWLQGKGETPRQAGSGWGNGFGWETEISI